MERPPGRCATAGGNTSWRRVPSCTTSIRIPANCRTSSTASRTARARSVRESSSSFAQEQTALRGAEPAAAAVPPDMLEKLGALGYVSPAASRRSERQARIPKDKIEEYKTLNTLMREGLVGLREGRFADSLARFQALFGHGVDSFESHYYAARALAGLKRWREAAVHYEGGDHEASRLHGRVPRARRRRTSPMARSIRRSTRCGEARRRSRRSAAHRTRRRHRTPARRPATLAARAYERVAQMAPRDALVRIKLGEVYRDLGRPADAARVMREAIQLDPATASYWNALGMVLGGANDFPGAEQAFREAATRDARNAQYAYNLGLALERQQQREAAVAQFRRALELDPRFAPARQRLAELR